MLRAFSFVKGVASENARASALQTRDAWSYGARKDGLAAVAFDHGAQIDGGGAGGDGHVGLRNREKLSMLINNMGG